MLTEDSKYDESNINCHLSMNFQLLIFVYGYNSQLK